MSEQEKPESLLSPEAKQILTETINAKVEQAISEGNYALASELQRAKKLVEKGCWSIRKANPYLEFVAECISTTKPHEGKLTLEETQKLMRECADRWAKLRDSEKAKYKALAGELGIYDFL